MPMMISGITNENSIRKLAPAGTGPRQRSRPMANATPRGTAMIIVLNDSFRLWIRAACNSGDTNSDPWGSLIGCPHHHCMENPCHTAFDRPELKAIPMAMATGRIDQARYSHVTPASTWGRRQGSRHHRETGFRRRGGALPDGDDPTLPVTTVSLTWPPERGPWIACSTASESSGTRLGTAPASPTA